MIQFKKYRMYINILKPISENHEIFLIKKVVKCFHVIFELFCFNKKLGNDSAEIDKDKTK